MASRPFRFIHAADFHLERPARGLSEVPEHLRELFRDAPYLAAAKVFDAALADEVDFVVLTGDLLDPHTAGLRALIFLTEQFQRLAQRGIAVYWTGGRNDAPHLWPPGFELPDNVHVIPAGRPTTLLHEREGEPVAQLVAASRGSGDVLRPSDLASRHEELFTLACVHGRVEAEQLTQHVIDYWALGGVHQRTVLLDEPYIAQYPGSPQGRSPEEPGVHGCWLVAVDEEEHVHTRFLATDVLRFVRQRIKLDDDATADTLAEQLRAACTELAAADLAQVVEWTVNLPAELCRTLRGADDELLEPLRVEFGCQQPALWTHRLKLQPRNADEALPPGLLGDFLALVEAGRSGESAEPHGELAALSDELPAPAVHEQQDVWHDVAELGRELLSKPT